MSEHIVYQKPLVKYGMEELAARQHQIQPSGGIQFTRKVDGEEKIAARQLVLDLFTRKQWPGKLHVLTMPGLQWRFERKLLGSREPGWMTLKRSPDHTYFTGCENDRSIFYAAVPQMPGLHTLDSLLRPLKRFPFAERGVKTRYATLFFANIDNLMADENWNEWDAAWLDYTGPLTVERMALIRRFFQQHIGSIIIVTALKARYNEATARAVEKAGGHSKWLRSHLDGEVLHDIEYEDTSPMAQLAVRKVKWKSPLI